jgi:hypothetical protein
MHEYKDAYSVYHVFGRLLTFRIISSAASVVPKENR